MTQKILGLDIASGLLSGVVLGQGRGERRVLARGVAAVADGEETGEALTRLLAELEWRGGPCICGVSLSSLSLRNLTLPFRDRRRISQVLPFELEDQLVVPVDEQVVEFLRVGGEAPASNLLVFCLEKTVLRRLLDLLAGCGVDPRRVTPSMLALATQMVRADPDTGNGLLLHADLHSLSLVLCRQGQPLFFRRLPYPEQMFTRPPFVLQGTAVRIGDRQQAADCIRSIRGDVQRSLDFFTMATGQELQPDRILLSGLLVTAPGFAELVRESLDRQVDLLDLRREAGVREMNDGDDGWQPGLQERALALALSGLERRGVVDFRQGEFAVSRGVLASRRRVGGVLVTAVLLAAAGLGWLWADYRALRSRFDDLGGQMRALYRQTFPGATRIVDPLAQMQANLRQMQAPRVSLPLFTGRKRILDILADISGRIPESVAIHVSRLVIDAESVQIKGTTDTFNNVDTIRNRLLSSPLYREVKIVSATAGKNKKIRFEIRLQLGEAS